jgi:hypothetical protein
MEGLKNCTVKSIVICNLIIKHLSVFFLIMYFVSMSINTNVTTI